MRRIAAILGALTVVFAGLAPADPANATTVPANWWSNQTASENVYEVGISGEGVRLHTAYSGYIEGTLALPEWGPWSIAFRAHTDETFDTPDEFIRVFINNALVEEIHNTPPRTHIRFERLVVGDGFVYRFEFSSPRKSYSYHMVMDPGTVVLMLPDVSQAAPSVAEIWPPNNKMVAVSILGVTDPAGGTPTITITNIIDNEDCDPADVGGIGSTVAQVRAQRDGSGAGRVYTISFVAANSQGESRGSVSVAVPHDQGKGKEKAARPAVPVDAASWGAIKGPAR